MSGLVIPAFSIDALDDDCANSSLWTATDVDPQESSSPETVSNVILVMLDGVRWQEIAATQNQNAPIFSYLHSTLSGDGHLFMNDRVANPYRVSLPAYQSIFAGAVQDCAHNKCGRVSTETFPERFVRELKLHPKSCDTGILEPDCVRGREQSEDDVRQRRRRALVRWSDGQRTAQQQYVARRQTMGVGTLS